MQKNYWELADLMCQVKSGVEAVFPERIWVRAEISSISRRQNGHAYLELCQSSGGTVVAKSRATIWSSRWNYIDQTFRAIAGSSLAAGMDILARVQVSFHVLYGLSLSIDEIDPAFTLGAAEKKRRETIMRLEAEGLTELQKRLDLPLLPYSLAVISASSAAGYGDFCNHLLGNEYGFAFRVDLFEALMQGDNAPASIMSALSRISQSKVRYDAVLVLRGGGSDLDLACFDDYDLGAAIARFPLPVFTAIGHDKDCHVADMTAKCFVKTPTALADLFLDCFIAEDQRLGSYETRLYLAFRNRLEAMSSALSGLEGRILFGSRMMLAKAEHALLQIESRIAASDPRSILGKGYVLALDKNGVKLTAASSLEEGGHVRIMFSDGTVECEVRKICI